MPIRPENRARYPADWKAISLEVRARAGNRCEGSPAYPDCREINGEEHTDTGSKVVLTVAHLDHVPENVGTPGDRPNLKAWCQRCHLTYDAPHHAATTRETRRRAMAGPTPDLFQGPQTNLVRS
ncbi:hypothetical protein [Caulobacter sp.]|uniref:hypothetical protein n=1 Tax=Caulobacter sp. TaxID=78 RepID=UPI003BB1DF24